MPIWLFRKTDTVGKPFCRTEFQLVFLHKERWRAFPILTTILFSLPADPCFINIHLDHKDLNLRSN
jgi:hypothetical protein